MAAAPPGMMQQTADPLAELRDIQLPPGIETWPPAPGWWLVAAVMLGLLGAALWALFQYWRRNRYRREARTQLRDIYAQWEQTRDDHAYLQAVQTLLKRVALTRFPRSNVASLTGEAWVLFLDQSSGSHDFSMSQSEALIDGNYRQDAQIDPAALQQSALQWINLHDPKHLQQATLAHDAVPGAAT